MLGEARVSPFLTDCWTALIRVVSLPGASWHLVSFRWVLMGVGCLSRMLGASLLLCNVVNQALSDVQVVYANMEFL